MKRTVFESRNQGRRVGNSVACVPLPYTPIRTRRTSGEMQVIIPGVNCPEPESCWLSLLPAERSAAFLPTFARISVALQLALREHVPALYFKKPERFRDWKAAYPMLVYQASRPFRGRVRTELTYDVLNPRLMTVLFRRAKANLSPLLERVEGDLHAAGLPDVAKHYAPRRAHEIIKSVQRLSASRRCLYLLVRGEGAMVDALIELTGLRAVSASEQAKRLAAFRKKWQFQLRRLYPAEDFCSLAPALLEAAKHALLVNADSRPNSDSDAGLITGREPGPGGA